MPRTLQLGQVENPPRHRRAVGRRTRPSRLEVLTASSVGGSDKLDRALCRFARVYADQVEQDHAALMQAVRRGVLPAVTA